MWEWNWNWKWFAAIVFAFLGWFTLAGCGDLNKWSDADIQKARELSKIAQSWGPQGRIGVRAGRPFVAGLVEGVILIPGFEADVSAEAAATDPLAEWEDISVEEEDTTTSPPDASPDG